MPSKKPIFPLRLDPELKARAQAVVADFPGSTLNGWINMLLQHHVERYETEKATRELEAIPSRNAFCACGSGKKFKRCCGPT